MYSIYYRIVDAGMSRMSPPGQHIGRIQDLLGEAVLWLILSGHGDGRGIAERFGDSGGDGTVHAAWVTLGHAGMIAFGLLMKVLAPHGDADR